MNEQAESEQLQNFHERLSQWLSGQGFWFQLRYSFSGAGIKGSFAYQSLRLAARLIMFLLVLAAGAFGYIFMKSDMTSQSQDVSAQLKEKLGAEEIEMGGLRRQKGEFSISRIAMTGKEGTFFTGLEIRNLKGRKSILDSFRKEWDPGTIRASSMNLDLRAGADSQKAAESIAAFYFQDTGGFKLSSIDVKNTSIRWGYSARSRGSIIGSNMRAERLQDGWKLRFRGGTFSQNWLKRLEIVELDVVFGRKGIVFEKALFRKNKGEISFINLKVDGGERPEVSGMVRLRKMDISSLLPMAVRNFVEGTLSAELNVFGSTNSSEGVGFEGDVVLEGEDMIVLRDRIHVLRALSVVDAFNDYRRIDFRDGSFHMKTHNGRLEITSAYLAAGDLFRMRGDITVRMPTPEESTASTTILSESDEADIFNEDEFDDELDITLERAARQANGENTPGAGSGGEESLSDKLGFGLEYRRIEEKAAERLSRTLHYAGTFQISLPKDAFNKAQGLAEAYPMRDPSGRILMDVPLKGVLYELTLKQADEIYAKGTR